MPKPPPQDDQLQAGATRDEASLRSRLDTLKADLNEVSVQDAQAGTGKDPSHGNAKALASGMRAASELVAGVLVGAGLGYFLDTQLGTKPWLFLVLLLAGMGAGFLNIYKLGMRTSTPGTDERPKA